MKAKYRTGRAHDQGNSIALGLVGWVTSDQAVAEGAAAESCAEYANLQVQLRASDPLLVPNLSSVRGGGETFLVFVNCTDYKVDYYWIDRNGIERYYKSVEPGSEVMQHSYEGHVWVVRDRAGVGLAVFRAAKSLSLALVFDSATK